MLKRILQINVTQGENMKWKSFIDHINGKPGLQRHHILIQPAFICSKLTIEKLEQGVKYFQS